MWMCSACGSLMTPRSGDQLCKNCRNYAELARFYSLLGQHHSSYIEQVHSIDECKRPLGAAFSCTGGGNPICGEESLQLTSTVTAAGCAGQCGAFPGYRGTQRGSLMECPPSAWTARARSMSTRSASSLQASCAHLLSIQKLVYALWLRLMQR